MVAALMLSVAALPFSITVCHGAIIIVIISWIFEGQWQNKLSVIKHSLLLQVIIALFFLQVLGLAFSDNLPLGLFALEKKIFFLLIPVAIGTTSLKLNRKEIKLVLITFIISCFVGTLLCVLHAWEETTLVMAGVAQFKPYLSTSSYHDLHAFESERWLMFSYRSLSQGIAIHPTFFSLFLAFSIIFLFHELPHLKSQISRGAVLMLVLYFAVFIVFLASRIVILGLSVIFTFVLIRTLLNKQKLLAFMVVIISAVFAFLLFLNPVSRYRSLEEINLSTFEIQPGNNYKNAAQIRVSLWWLAFMSLHDSHPLVGTGTGDVHSAMVRTSNQYQITNIINSFDPHNQYLYTLLGNGYSGFILLVLCLALPLYFAWIQQEYLLLGFSFIFSLLCFTESALELQKGVVFYSLFSALLFFQLNSFQKISFNLRSLIHARD
ncbi:MAG: O-antigen ligase family protein [Cyclobacteriaceae bacterium]